MQVIILCGGLGTRLKTVVSNVPKPMAPIQGTPFMQLQLDRISNFDVDKVVFATGYKKEIIRDYFGDKYKGMELNYSEEDSPLGTGGALKKALTYIDEDCALVMNGDVFLDIDLNEFMEEHKKYNAWETMALKPMTNFSRYGNVIIQDGKMVEFREKEPTEKGLVNIGCFIVRKDIFDAFPELGDKFSHEIDYMSKQANKREHRPFIYNGYFVDIGIPEDYFSFIEYIKNDKNQQTKNIQTKSL